MPELDFYKVLQVDSEADPEVIQAAYRRLAQKFHPDVALDAATAHRMRAINVAWETLRDPVKRAEYDRRRALAASAPTSTGQPTRPRTSEATGEHAGGAAGPSGGRGPSAKRPDAADEIFGHRASPGPDGPTSEPSRDWTSGRSTIGGGYDPATMRAPDGVGAAGPPPGNPSGSIVTFGRYSGWSLGEIARTNLDYLEWLDRTPTGRSYREEIDAILRRAGRRRSADAGDKGTRGLFRRR
jgi:curved DNA-binding protein CbpA